MIKRAFMGRRIVAVLLVLAVVVALGCSTREEALEKLDLCGNHSCGDLVMITVDTSSSGWQYLDPALSPDGTRVAFTADSEEVGGEERRKILVLPMPADPWTEEMRNRMPVTSIAELGAQYIRLNRFDSWFRGTPLPVTNAAVIDKATPIWFDDNTLIMVARFGARDRMLIVDISNPAASVAKVVFYEHDDLLQSGGWLYYHGNPALSPDGRWLLFSRFGCDREPNAYEPGDSENVQCTNQSLWVLDMETIVTENIQSPDDLRQAVFFPLTSEALQVIDPAWSPDGRLICFAATTDIIGQFGNMTTEIFSIRFDPEAAAEEPDAVTLDLNLRRLTTTTILPGDPIVGLHNYAPTFSWNGTEIYFTSTRRAPATTMRARSIWRIPYDGRLEPEILFYSRRDDVQPTVVPGQDWILFTSRMGFSTRFLNWMEATVTDSLMLNEPSMTEAEILRIAAGVRNTLEFYENVMSHLYLFRGF